MNKLKQRLKYLSFFIGLGLTVPLTNCNSENNTDIVCEKDQTRDTLNTYNKYLREISKSKRVLTEEDLENIIQNTHEQDTILLKLEDGTYNQANKNEYSVYMDENDDIRLFIDDFESENDLFRNQLVNKDYVTYISSLGEYIEDHNLETIGYGISYRAWSDQEKEYIWKNYGEDVFYCFSDIGFPKKLYNVEDFYDCYHKDMILTR